MTPAQRDLSPVVYGDTWNGIANIVVAINGAPPAEALAHVEMSFRSRLRPSVAALTLTSENGITINDAAGWDFTVNEQEMALTPAVYDWSIKTTDAAGVEKTYLKGSLQVLGA